MKKSIIVLILVLAMFLSACASSSEYKYADSFNTETAQAVDVMNYIKAHAKTEPTAGYNNLLTEIKGLVAEKCPYYDKLNCDKFEQINGIYELDIDASDVESMSPEEILVFSSYRAVYDEESDNIYLLPQFYAVNEVQKAYCLIHETIHALVPNWGSGDDSVITEGLVDWMALQVCNESGLNVTPAYQESIYCLRMLMDIYGEENVVQAICENRIVELIDSSTKDGMAEKLNIALVAIHGNSLTTKKDIQEATYVELDILTHAAKHEGVDISNWLDVTAEIYKANGIKLNTSYFKKIT